MRNRCLCLSLLCVVFSAYTMDIDTERLAGTEKQSMGVTFSTSSASPSPIIISDKQKEVCQRMEASLNAEINSLNARTMRQCTLWTSNRGGGCFFDYKHAVFTIAGF